MGSPDTHDRYLDLLKRTLSFTLWPEPPVPLARLNFRRPAWKRTVVRWLDRLLARRRLRLMHDWSHTPAERREGLTWPTDYADTMIGLVRLDNVQTCIETVLREGVPGDLLEAGVWRGGACILMRAVLAVHGVTDRRVFVADSFAGLPPPDESSYPADRGDRHHTFEFLAVSAEEVAANFKKYGLLDAQVVFLPGWFKDTLPAAPIERLAVLRLDGDMYSSTMETLTALYPKLSPGGFCIIDDYGAVPGCRQAVEDYRHQHGLTETLVTIDWGGRFWRKA